MPTLGLVEYTQKGIYNFNYPRHNFKKRNSHHKSRKLGIKFTLLLGHEIKTVLQQSILNKIFIYELSILDFFVELSSLHGELSFKSFLVLSSCFFFSIYSAMLSMCAFRRTGSKLDASCDAVVHQQVNTSGYTFQLNT